MDLITEIKRIPKQSIILISGFGGSGKSTLAREIEEKISSNIVSIDDFYRDLNEYSYWNCFDYESLIREVIIPFKNGQKIEYNSYNWEAPNEPINKTLDVKEYLIIEGVGLFNENILQNSDYKVWVDTSIEDAVKCGKDRDNNVYGVNNDLLWEGIWKRNDLECYSKYKPIEKADYIYAWK